jgi:hypothetical protein
MNKYEIEIPKYLKQRESNISKAKKKSKHKHHYEECLIQNPFSFAGKNSIHTQLSSYCTICGKIGEYLKSGKYSKEIESLQKQRQEEDKHFCVISISGEELYEKYHDKLPVFFVEDIFKEKYVDLGQNNNPDGE